MITRTGKALNTTMLLTKGSTATIILDRMTTPKTHRHQQQPRQKRCLKQQQSLQQQQHLQEEHNNQQLHHLLQHQQQHMLAITRRSTPTLPGKSLISAEARWTAWRSWEASFSHFWVGSCGDFQASFFFRKRANQAKLPSTIFTDVSLLKESRSY